MRRILLVYQGKKVINSEVKHHYRHKPFKPSRSKRQPKDYYFDQILFPYHVLGSCIIGHKEGSKILEPYWEAGIKVQTFSLYLNRKPTQRRKGKIKVNDKVFVLKDRQGRYGLLDPLTDDLLATKEIGLLQMWDVHYPIMEDYFKHDHKYHSRVIIHYLDKSEIKRLTI